MSHVNPYEPPQSQEFTLANVVNSVGEAASYWLKVFQGARKCFIASLIGLSAFVLMLVLFMFAPDVNQSLGGPIGLVTIAIMFISWLLHMVGLNGMCQVPASSSARGSLRIAFTMGLILTLLMGIYFLFFMLVLGLFTGVLSNSLFASRPPVPEMPVVLMILLIIFGGIAACFTYVYSLLSGMKKIGVALDRPRIQNYANAALNFFMIKVAATIASFIFGAVDYERFTGLIVFLSGVVIFTALLFYVFYIVAIKGIADQTNVSSQTQ